MKSFTYTLCLRNIAIALSLNVSAISIKLHMFITQYGKLDHRPDVLVSSVSGAQNVCSRSKGLGFEPGLVLTKNNESSSDQLKPNHEPKGEAPFINCAWSTGGSWKEDACKWS